MDDYGSESRWAGLLILLAMLIPFVLAVALIATVIVMPR